MLGVSNELRNYVHMSQALFMVKIDPKSSVFYSLSVSSFLSVSFSSFITMSFFSSFSFLLFSTSAFCHFGSSTKDMWTSQHLSQILRIMKQMFDLFICFVASKGKVSLEKKSVKFHTWGRGVMTKLGHFHTFFIFFLLCPKSCKEIFFSMGGGYPLT